MISKMHPSPQDSILFGLRKMPLGGSYNHGGNRISFIIWLFSAEVEMELR